MNGQHRDIMNGEHEVDDWADAKEEQVNDKNKDLSVGSEENNDSRSDSSRTHEPLTCLDKQPTEFCSRTCLTGSDPGTGSLILHEAVFNNDSKWIYQILENKDLAQKTVNKKDKHGNTPLHLACMLGRSKEIVQALLDSKASIECKNLNRWNPFHEACSYGNRDIIALMTKQLETGLHNALNKNSKLSESLKKTKDYQLTLRWEFQSWVPLIAKALPNDLCTITKYGNNIRIDTGLFEYGMDLTGWMSGNSTNCCLIYNNNHEKNWSVLNHNLKKYQHLGVLNVEKKNIEDRVDECMAMDIIDFELKSRDIQLTRGTSGWIWKAEKKAVIGRYNADIYNVDNVSLVTRKRREHLTEDDMKRNKMVYRAAISIFKFGKKPTIEDLTPAENGCDDDESINDNYSEGQQEDGEPAAVEHRKSLLPPPATNVTWEQYLESDPGEYPVLGRKHKCKTSTTAFKASVAMTQQFPIDKNEFLNLLSIVPMKLFKKLKEFIEMRLPEGFPIRLDIPVFPPFLTSRITFESFKFIQKPLPESMFNIPADYIEDPNLYPAFAGHPRN